MLFYRDYRRPFWRGFLHAVILVLYLLSISVISYSLPRLFVDTIGQLIRWAFSIFLIVLTLAVSGYLVFFEPMRHIVHHQFKRAGVMIFSTIGWLFIFLIVFLIGLLWTASL